jgi:hypothetical protein
MTRQAASETETDADEGDLEQMERAMRAAGVSSLPHAPKAALPLEYAQRRPEKAPFDWAGAIRQIVFAAGIGFVAGAFTDAQWPMVASQNGDHLWIGFGAALVALALPWPGRVGRRRAL